LLADAAADAFAEREIDEFIARFFDRQIFPTFGLKFVRVFPETGIAVRDELARQNERFFSERKAAEFVFFNRQIARSSTRAEKAASIRRARFR
jgi:hypothetical protein